MELSGIHHVTAISGSGPVNLAFYTQVLGLRLVKKTVNQDVPSTYHLFYGDDAGNPGTEMTFFEWPDAGPHSPGFGDVADVSFVVPDRRALEWWTERFDAEGVEHHPIEERAGREVLRFADREGQRLELVVGRRDDTTPWHASPIPAEFAIRGFAAVTLVVNRLDPTVHILVDMLGFRQRGEYTSTSGQHVLLFETGEGGLGTEVHVMEETTGRRAHQGIGGVHHVAFRVPDDVEHKQWQEKLAGHGLAATPVIDRYYFKSIYFREPGGVLFELATDGPGFTADEDIEHLGEHLSLPPFLEPQRAQIEAVLPPLATKPELAVSHAQSS